VIIALIAAAVASIGDFILLAAANAGNAALAWVPAPSDGVLLVGTYLGLLAIPCYALGYLDAARRLDDAHGRPLRHLGTVIAVLGGTTHALTGLAIHLQRGKDLAGADFAAVLEPAGTYLAPIWMILAAASILAGYYFTAGVLSGGSSLPTWTAPANPIALTLAISLVTAPFTFGAAFLVPAAPNLSHVIFFGMLAFLSRTDRPAVRPSV